MTGSLGAVFFAMLAFVGGHFLLSSRPVRKWIVGSIGEAAFSAGYSVLMVLALAWVIAAYRVAPPLVVWDFGRGVNLVPIVVMPFALILVVLGIAAPNPTAVMGGRLLEGGPRVAGVQTITRHPFLAGTALWALSHLVANGDAASILLFGGMALLSIAGMSSIDRRRARMHGRAWSEFASRTSRLPFGAALAGRVKVDWAGIGWVRPALALVLYVVLYQLHDWLFGVPVIVG